MLMPSIFGESLLDDFFDEFNGGTRNRVRYAAPSNGVMRTDIKESADDYEISIDLPGYQKEDVQAELKDGYLVISAKNERSTDDSDGKTYDATIVGVEEENDVAVLKIDAAPLFSPVR